MKNTKKLTFSAIISALAVAVMYIGVMLEVLDLSMAALASICVMLVLTELGMKYAFLSYACIGVLSFLLLPTKYAAIMFVGFLGFYPMAKLFFERKFRGILCLILKFALLNFCIFAMLLLVRYVMTEALWFEIMVLVLANIVFVVYDIALTRLLRAYVLVWRKKLKIKF
ncbi:MAG: hypothetical protein IJN48_00780 [Clostridia bacterium]|nr:hypothetical protein [Clostridia bacterium]